MTINDDVYSNARLMEAGDLAGYASKKDYGNGTSEPAEEMFNGRLSFESYSTGISVYFSDMVSVIESEHEGLLERSWTLAINLSEQPEQIGIGRKRRLILPPSGAKVVALSDQERMANRVEAGLRCRSLLLRLAPGVITDSELAEAIDRDTHGTQLDDIAMTSRLRYLATCLTEPSPSSAPERLLAESRALELVAHVLSQNREIKNDRLNSLAQRDRMALMRVRDVIHATPSQDFTLQELATEAGMSLSSLKTKFPQAFGTTVFSYLRNVRLEYACEQIAQNGWSITQAAHFAGYSHVGNFSKAFRKRFGVNPTDMN